MGRSEVAPRPRVRWTASRVTAVLVCVGLAFIVVVLQPTGRTVATRADLDLLATMSPSEAAVYLEEHPQLRAEAMNADPSTTADWWQDLSEADRRRALRSSPEMVGNLDGVEYATRDTANRRFLDRLIDRAKRSLEARPGDENATHRLAALTAILKAADAKHSPPRHLITLFDESPPLAAIVVGDLDEAEQVTYNVPGMGTYTDDMQLWTLSAQNLREHQLTVGSPTTSAVVAWINYRTPPPGVDATLGEYASQGAPRLARDILGLQATRVKDPVDTVNIVAHSYGTTTAADALADEDLGVHAFVMLGSAGIEQDIEGASALSAERVYAGEASADPEARFGRFSRTDPRSPSFGALVIDVDGSEDEGLLPVTGHEPILHSQWNDDPMSKAWTKYEDPVVAAEKYFEHQQTFGYLDNGTESLLNTAIATTRSPTRRFVD